MKIKPNSFAKKIWQGTSKLIDKGKEQDALVFLFESLNGEMINAENCDAFLELCTKKSMSSDIIVHTISALSPIRPKLRNWTKFIDRSRELLVKELGPEKTEILFKSLIV